MNYKKQAEIDNIRVKIMVAKDHWDYDEVRRLQQLMDKLLEDD